jgi:hypothetical protein
MYKDLFKKISVLPVRLNFYNSKNYFLEIYFPATLSPNLSSTKQWILHNKDRKVTKTDPNKIVKNNRDQFKIYSLSISIFD